MKYFLLVYSAVCFLLCAYRLGEEYPRCCPGDRRGCNVPSGQLGIEYCRESGFGWESCQKLPTAADEPYPQALWRKK